MEIISHIIDETMGLPKNHCVFDIETTGLSHSHSHVILIGVLFEKKGKTHIKQIFAHDRQSEKELLFYFKELFNTFDGHISYNGFSFDIPFLNARLENYSIDFHIEKENGIDLLKIVRSNKELLGLESCRLKDIERALGIQRDDAISGKESVQLYKLFEKSQDENLKSKILLHNHDDIYYLSKLLNIRGFIEEKKAQNSIALNINGQESLAFMESFKVKGLALSLVYSLNSNIHMPFEVYEKNFSVKSKNDSIEMDIDLIRANDSDGKRLLAFDAGSLIPVKKESLIKENISQIGSLILKALFPL